MKMNEDIVVKSLEMRWKFMPRFDYGCIEPPADEWEWDKVCAHNNGYYVFRLNLMENFLHH